MRYFHMVTLFSVASVAGTIGAQYDTKGTVVCSTIGFAVFAFIYYFRVIIKIRKREEVKQLDKKP